MAPIKDLERGIALNEQPRISKKSYTPRSRKLLPNRSTKAKSKGRVGLPRPKSQISYNIPRNIQELVETTTNDPTNPSLLSNHKNDASRSASRSSTPTPSSDLPPLIHLSRIATLLDLIHRRNKNQHRNQNFYKWFNLLRRSIKNLVSLYYRVESLNLNSGNKGSASNPTTGGILNAESIRKVFELRSELRSQIEVSEEWIRETLVPGCFVSFSSVVADNQFANLGVVLMGILGDVVGRVGTMRRIDKVPQPLPHSMNGDSAKTKLERGQRVTSEQGGGLRSEGERVGRSILGVSTLITGPDQGEVVERIYSDVDADADEEESLDPANNKIIEDEGVSIQRSRDDGDDKDEFEVPNNNAESSSSTPATDKFPSPGISQSALLSSSKSQLSHHIDSNSKLESRPKQPAQKPSPANSEFVLESLGIQSDILERKEQKQDRNNEEEREKASKVANAKDKDKDKEMKKKKKTKKGEGNAIDDLFGGLF